MDIRDWLSRANKKRHELKKVKPGSDAERCLLAEIDDLEWEIQQAIDEVSEPQLREVLALRYVLGMSTQEIAEDLECSKRSIQRCLKNARCRFSS